MNLILRDGLDRAGLILEPDVCLDLDIFLTEMLRWNRKVNLTAITDPAAAVEKHLVDSLLILPLLGAAKSLLDMGSGAGLPGIPVMLARPDLDIVSVDSVGKKINFQKHVKRLLGLSRFVPIQSRLESLGSALPQGACFDLVTARAFSSMEMIVHVGAPWLSSTGKILAMKGPEGEGEALAAEKTIQNAGLQLEHVYKYNLPISGAERQIIVLSKKTQKTTG